MRTGWIWAGVLVFAFTGTATAGQAVPIRVAQASARDQAKAKKKEGDQFFRAKKFAQAEAAYTEAIKLDKGWYKAYEALGNLQFSSKKYAAAIESFMKAVEVEPRYHTGLYNIAFAYRKSGNYAKAVEYYQKYIKEKPNDPDAFYGMAASFEAKGDKKGAIDAYLKYADMEKRPSEKKYVIKARNKADALKKELGLDEKPKPAVAAKPEPKPEPKPAAKPEPKPAVVAKPEPKSDSEKSNQVIMWIAEGDKAMAVEKYTKAMKHYFDAARAEPRNTEAVYKLGLVYEKTGNVRAAELKWRTVLKIDPDHAPSKQALARLSQPKSAAKPEPKPEPKPAVVAKPEPKPEPKPAPKPEPKPAVVAKPEPKPAPKPVETAALTADQRKAMAKVGEGDRHFKRKSFAKAIAAYTHATQLSPKNEEAMFKLATAYAYAGNLKVAVFKWKQVLRLNPNHAAAKRNIARAEAQLSGKSNPAPAARAKPASKPAPAAAPKPEPKPAPKAAAPVAKANPAPKANSFEAWAAEAAAAKKRGDAKGVLDATGRALRIKKDASMAILRGEALVILKRYGEAKKAFSRAMVLDPNLAAPFYGLGQACRMTGEKDRARYYFKMYVRSKAKDVKPALIQKAQAFLK